MRMFSILVFVFAFIISTGINVSLADVLFYDDCEGDPLDNGWKYAQHNSSRPGWSITRSNKVKKSGSYSYKFVLNAVDSNASYNTGSGDKHCQLSLLASVKQGGDGNNRNFSYNKEYWTGMSIYIPKNAALPKSDSNKWVDLVDYHGSADKCDQARQAPLDMFMRDDAVVIRVKGQTAACAGKTYDRNKYFYLPLFKLGAWNDVVMNFKFSHKEGGGGFLKVWVNGKKVLSDSGINAFNDKLPPYLKVGLYGTLAQQLTVYYDEIRIGGERSSYNQVAPKGSAQLPDDTNPTNEDLVPPTLSITVK